MSSPHLPASLSRPPVLSAYLAATALASFAVACRAALQAVLPGPHYFAFLLPVVVIAGAFCGTLPGLVAAAITGFATSLLFLSPPLFSGPLASPAHAAVLIYFPACAAVLWATNALREAARSAASTQARLSEVFRQVPAAAAILEAPSGRLLLNSARSRQLLGHPILGGNSADDIAAYGGIDDAGRPYEPDAYPIVRALRYGEVVHGEALRYKRPDGRIIDLDVHAGPVRDEAGNVVAAVGMAFDVTERREAECRLLESEAKCRAAAEQLRAAIDAGSLGTWEIDLATRQMRIDAGMAAMLGMKPEPVEISRAVMLGHLHPEDQPGVSARLQAAVAAGGSYGDEFRIVAADGATRWIVSRGAVLQESGKAVGVVSDITDRRERENALIEALEARDVLMHEADHRIKNSLQLVVALLRIQMGKTSDPAIRHALGEAVARVDAIANAHLALQGSPDLRSIPIDAMLASLCDRISVLNPSIDVFCRAASELSLDAEQAMPLGLIASELLTNALKHAYPPGTPGTVSMIVARQDGRLELTIEDAGAGYPSGQEKRGLGSTLITTLARQIGAEVFIQSTSGKGVQARICLSAPASQDAASTGKSQELVTSG